MDAGSQLPNSQEKPPFSPCAQPGNLSSHWEQLLTPRPQSLTLQTQSVSPSALTGREGQGLPRARDTPASPSPLPSQRKPKTQGQARITAQNPSALLLEPQIAS